MAYRPAWVNKEGWPLSWQHYVYGMKHIAREHIRTQLSMAQAVRLASVEYDSWTTWQNDMHRITEVPRHG